jgi:hypothetical protein
MVRGLDDFYNSKEWSDFRKLIIAERTREDGFIYDEMTGKPIVKAYDLILHHKEPLTEENVRDFSISLNPDNIMVVSFATHNKIHNRRGWKRKEVFLVYGSPLSGKTSWVNENKDPGDLVVDIDNIWQCVTGLPRFEKPDGLKSVVFSLRNNLYDTVRHRLGRWQCAYIVGGFPLISERERLIKEMGAREVFIDTDKDECLRRLKEDTQRDQQAWQKYIDDWWRHYSPSLHG